MAITVLQDMTSHSLVHKMQGHAEAYCFILRVD